MTLAAFPLIAPATEEEVHSGELGRAIRAFNYGFVGEYGQAETIHLNAKDADGTLAGGVRSYVFLDWLRVDILFVAEAHRGQRLGSRLLADAEKRALAKGARGVTLGTFGWQAEGFYLKQGYSVDGRIPDYYKGHELVSMHKRFA